MSTSDHSSAQHTPQPLLTQVESYAREEPLKAVSGALGAGILMALLPVGGILSLIGRIFFLLARPILMILGVVKLVEHFGERNASRDGE